MATWSADVLATIRASRRAAWIIAGCAAAAASVEAVALRAMLPLRTVVPYTLDLDQSRGVAGLTRNVPGDAGDIRVQLAKYVIRRESYDDSHPRDGVTEVLAQSREGARRSYAAGLKNGVPDLSKLVFQLGTQVHVTVQAVTWTGPGRARVTFAAAQTQNGSIFSTLPWQADISFSAQPGGRSPGGQNLIEVTSYQRTAFIPTQPNTSLFQD